MKLTVYWVAQVIKSLHKTWCDISRSVADSEKIFNEEKIEVFFLCRMEKDTVSAKGNIDKLPNGIIC